MLTNVSGLKVLHFLFFLSLKFFIRVLPCYEHALIIQLVSLVVRLQTPIRLWHRIYFLVFFFPSRQISGECVSYAETTSFRILISSSFICRSIRRQNIKYWKHYYNIKFDFVTFKTFPKIISKLFNIFCFIKLNLKSI